MKSDFQAKVARHRQSPADYLDLREVAREFLACGPSSDWSQDEVVDFLYVCESDEDEELFDSLGYASDQLQYRPSIIGSDWPPHQKQKDAKNQSSHDLSVAIPTRHAQRGIRE